MLTARGIRLRLLDAGDRGLYRDLYTSPEVMQAIAPPLAVEAADAQFERVVRHNSLDVPGHRAWRIECAPDGVALGLAALLRQGPRAEYGIMLLPPAWQRGVASAVSARVLAEAFGPLGLVAVDASRPADAQVAVIDRLLLPLGFRRMAGLRAGEIGWRLSAADWLPSDAPGEAGPPGPEPRHVRAGRAHTAAMHPAADGVPSGTAGRTAGLDPSTPST